MSAVKLASENGRPMKALTELINAETHSRIRSVPSRAADRDSVRYVTPRRREVNTPRYSSEHFWHPPVRAGVPQAAHHGVSTGAGWSRAVTEGDIGPARRGAEPESRPPNANTDNRNRAGNLPLAKA